MGRGRRKKVKNVFETLTIQAYKHTGGQFDRRLAAQCAYYPRFGFGRLVCINCSFEEPHPSCKRAHILRDTDLKRCELCGMRDDTVILTEGHTLHPECLERVLEAACGAA